MAEAATGHSVARQGSGLNALLYGSARAFLEAMRPDSPGCLVLDVEGVAKYTDEVAERLQGIGVSSDGRATTIVRTSRIPEFPGGFVDDVQVIQWFAQYYRVTSDEIGQGIKATNDSYPTTSNLLQEVQHAIDKYQWQMRAMIQATPTDPKTGADLNNGRPFASAGRPSATPN